MAKIKILQFPNVRLREKAIPVKEITPKIQKIIDDMFKTHYGTENCAALAATQLDLENPPRITVIDFSPQKNQPLCLINPEIIERHGELTQEEGCMSIAGAYENVTRAAKIKVRALDREGKLMEFEAEGFMAKCIQHEIDHLDGMIYFDRLSSFKRKRAEEKVKKYWRRIRKIN